MIRKSQEISKQANAYREKLNDMKTCSRTEELKPWFFIEEGDDSFQGN